MGNSQSQSVQQAQAVVNSVVNNITNSTTAGATSDITVGNTVDFENYGTINAPNGGINITQANSVVSKVTVNATVTQTSQLQTDLTSKLQAAAQAASASKQGALALGFNVQNTTENLNQAISNYVTNNVTNSTTTSVQGFINSLNSGTFKNFGTINVDGAGGITIDQTNVVDQIVTLILKSLTVNTTATAIGNALAALDKSDQSSEQKGVVDSIMNALKSIADDLKDLGLGAIFASVLLCMCPCITLIVCACICCGGAKGGGGGKNSSTPSVIQVAAPAAPAAPAATVAFGKQLNTHLRQIKKLKI